MKIAFVVQRCGKEIVGGAENVCLNIASRLSQNYDVDILTSCALDYMTWKNHFPSGISSINGARIIRFETDFERNVNEFNSLSEKVLTKSHSSDDELSWMKMQGPYCSSLFQYIQENKDNYDLFIFFTYLYATTYYGLKIVPSKNILVPLAHDEPPLKLSIFDSVFQNVKGIIFSTAEEQKILTSRFHFSVESQLIGLGVNIPLELPPNYAPRFHLDSDYVLYLGRIDKSKGCDDLIQYFNKFLKETKSQLKLVLAGPKIFEFDENENIIYLGELDEKEKSWVLKKMSLFIMPSPYESFSIATMEAWLCKKPVLVNAKSTVLKSHCENSNGGLFYSNYEEFSKCMNLILKNKELSGQMGKNGFDYVLENYTWDKIIIKYRDFIEKLVEKVPENS